MAPTKLVKWGIEVSLEGYVLSGEKADGSKVKSALLVTRKAVDVLEDEEGATWQVKAAHLTDKYCAHLSKKTAQKLKKNGFGERWARTLGPDKKALQLQDRMFEVQWRDLPFIGIEYRAIPEIYGADFSFPQLKRKLKEIYNANGNTIYLFMGAQPVYLGSTAAIEMLEVPYIVAIDCAVPPPSKLAYHSLQLAQNDIIEMGKSQSAFARYEWAPYIPKKVSSSVGLSKSMPKVPLHILSWAGRASQFSNLNEEEMHYIEYLMPYIQLPQHIEQQEKPDVTNVHIEWEHDGKKYDIVFDKEIDRLATFIPEFLEDNELEGKVENDVIKQVLIDAFKAKRAKVQEEWDALQKQLKSLSKEEDKALREIQLYKFYPSHPQLDLSAFMDPKINQYYGKADHLVPPNAYGDEEGELEEDEEENNNASGNTRKRGRPSSASKKKKQQQQQQSNNNNGGAGGNVLIKAHTQAETVREAQAFLAKKRKTDDDGDVEEEQVEPLIKARTQAETLKDAEAFLKK